MSQQIDILMATYQGAHYLREQIDSIRLQSYPHWRLIIRDDGSKDETWEILQSLTLDPELRDRILLLPRGERLGVVGNFSRLMQSATSPYVMFADQDDVWFPNKIEKTLAKMHAMEKQYSTTGPILVHTDLQVVAHDKKQIHASYWKYAGLNAHEVTSLNRLLAQNVVTGCTVMLNRALLQLSQPISKSACMHDWWLALAASAFGNIGIVPEPTMAYRQHLNNQLGAQRYGLNRIWNRGLFAIHTQRATQRSEQALAFQRQFQDLLDPKQIEMLVAFQDYCKGSFWAKRRAMFKYKFYKSGWLRNIFEALF